MWKLLKALWSPQRPMRLRCTIDFTKPRSDHWVSFDGGTNFDAHFTIRGQVTLGDQILVRMQSGRIGCYRLFSVRPDFMGLANWKAQGIGVNYRDDLWPPTPKIKGLLTDGTRWVRSSSGELAHLPSGFTKPASEFWSILVRDEARRGRSNSMRTTGNL